MPDYNKPALKHFLDKKDIEIAACSFRFSDFPGDKNDENINVLLDIVYNSKNCTLFHDKSGIYSEYEARNKGLSHLLDVGCDVIMVVDSDERYNEKDVDFLLEVINNPSFEENAWYSINFKNYIFDEKTWIDGFCPPRLFNVYFKDYELKEFYWDNDVFYNSMNVYLSSTVDYKELPNAVIDKSKLHIKHLTWLGERAIQKVHYQIKHYGQCSYKVKEDGTGIEFNDYYFQKNNEVMPELHYDE